MSFAGDFLDRVRTRFKAGSLPGAYQDTFDSIPGRVVLHDLVDVSGLMRTDHSGLKPEDQAYCAGMQDMVRHIFKQLRVRPQDLQQFADREVIHD